jgi:hypothetical protein
MSQYASSVARSDDPYGRAIFDRQEVYRALWLKQIVEKELRLFLSCFSPFHCEPEADAPLIVTAEAGRAP